MPSTERKAMHPDKNAAPLNPLPPVVWALVIPIVIIEIAFNLGARGLAGGPTGVGWRSAAIQLYAFSDPAWEWMIENRQFPMEHLLRFLTYPFIQWNATQAVFAAVFTLALGKFVGEVFRAWAVLVVFFGSSVAGAIVYGLALDTRVGLVGSYPAAYGLIGAFSFILWTRLGEKGENRSRAFLLIGALMVFQLVIAAFNWIFYGATDSFWIAELSGFAAGFLLSFLVSPGGWSRVLQKMRQS